VGILDTVEDEEKRRLFGFCQLIEALLGEAGEGGPYLIVLVLPGDMGVTAVGAWLSGWAAGHVDVVCFGLTGDTVAQSAKTLLEKFHFPCERNERKWRILVFDTLWEA
jgi:hypothetical protein